MLMPLRQQQRQQSRDKVTAWHRLSATVRLRCFSYLPVCHYEHDWYAPHTALGLKSDKDLAIVAAKKNWKIFEKYASPALKKNKLFILHFLREKIWWKKVIEFASDDMKNDSEIIMAAVTQHYSALKYASNELKQNKQLVMFAIQQHGRALRYASEELRKDREVVMAAVQKNDVALEYASKNLRNDKDIVMVAVRQNGNSLRYASNEMKNDKNVVLMAVAQNCYGLLYASEGLQGDEDVIRIAMEKNEFILEDLGLVRMT
jgi:hypothetical protein